MKVKFLTTLELESLGMRHDRSFWRLAHDFWFTVDGVNQSVPAGFESDLGSVPRLPLTYLLAGDVSHKAPLIHDWLYSRKADRKWADRVFMAALKEEGVARWRRTLMYLAVRAFGGWNFNRR